MDNLKAIDERIKKVERVLKYLQEQRREEINRLNLNKVNK